MPVNVQPLAAGLEVAAGVPGAAEAEARRLDALGSYRILDTPPESAFDDLTRLAARACDAPIAFVSLIDRERQWFKAKFGLDTGETSRDQSFCSHAILDPNHVFEVPDARVDSRFADKQWVRSGPQIRFYAGAPLVDRAGYPLGALGVLDRVPRALSPDQREALEILSRQVVALLELRRGSHALEAEARARRSAEAELRDQNETLRNTQAEANQLLGLAESSRVALLSVLEDEQHSSRALTRSNRALKMLGSCNEALIWANDEMALLKQICRIAVELGGHRMAFVGYAQEDAFKSILPMGQWGDDQGYLASVNFTWADDVPMGRGPAGRCIREGKTVVCGDVRDPAGQFHTQDEAASRSYRSVVCLPLGDKDRTFGLLGLYSDEVGDLAEPEIRLLQDLANDLAFGISAIRARVAKDQSEAALVASVREKDALLKEVHHRVKNNLQVIASLLRLEGRRIDHEVTKSVLDQMQARIRSMSLLHETLYRSGNFARIDLKVYLGQIATQLFRSLATQPAAVRLSLDLDSTLVDIEQAIPCGLIVNELASNSLKHAFPEGRAGEVRIRLRSTNTGGVVLSVSDDGIGLPKDFDSRRGRSLGLQLVSDLSRQLQGALTVGAGPEAAFEVTFANTRKPTLEIPPILKSAET